jgi:polyphenol oxidase
VRGDHEAEAVIVRSVELTPDARAWFTGRDVDGLAPSLGRAGNLAHRRPHVPADLARTRAAVGVRVGVPPERWHLMHQVHGGEVAVVDAATPLGAELRGVDAAVTTEPERPLVVQVADCVPVVFAGGEVVGVAHAGRLGVQRDVVGTAVAAAERLGTDAGQLRAVVGPAIGGCCYEVPATMRDEVGAVAPVAVAATTWGTPSLDLPAAVETRLEELGVTVLERVGSCTRCDPEGRWFSHRADPDTGRQVALVVRRPTAGR